MTYEEEIRHLNSYDIEDTTEEDDNFVFAFACQERLISEPYKKGGAKMEKEKENDNDTIRRNRTL